MRSDGLRVAEIYVASWNAGFGELMPTLVLDDERVERWASDLTEGAGQWWVATVAGEVVGFCGIGPSRDPVDPSLGELDTIAVEPGYWRRGVGATLMRTALEALAAFGYRKAIVWTLANYPQGRHFYESAGWVRDGGTRDDGHQISLRHDLVATTGAAEHGRA